MTQKRHARKWLCCTTAVAAAFMIWHADARADAQLFVPASRSTLVRTSTPMGEVIVADPAIADVRAHGDKYLSVVAKKPGVTTIRVFDRNHRLLKTYDVTVGYDLVAIRHALKDFLPDENIGVEMVNTNIALTGKVSSAAVADKAVRIAGEFVPGASAPTPQGAAASAPLASGAAASSAPAILNLLQVTSGQQVLLRVRVGEIQRTALKALGMNLNAITRATGSGLGAFTSGGDIASLIGQTGGAIINPSAFVVPNQSSSTAYQGALFGRWQPNGPNGNGVAGLLEALEQDGLFKLLAEPNLVAVSGQEAKFLAGGEIPIPVPQATGTVGAPEITIEYKPYGVAVRFKPFVLSENRIRMEVQPEVSELDNANALNLSGFRVPALTTRRADTTVELAPGESFMIAGLLSDQSQSDINQLPGLKELPILGALFRSTQFQRNETELVIAVTPYLADPMKSSDVKLPTDNFMPASDMEMFFYGALGSLYGNTPEVSQSPSLEGPIGFMVD